METRRAIRKSGFGDYFAVDYIDKGGKIVETPLYLKKGEQAKIRMRFDDGTISQNQWDDQHCWMEDALIKFDGKKVLVAYAVPSLGQSEINWFEPSENELLHPSIIHYKTATT